MGHFFQNNLANMWGMCEIFRGSGEQIQDHWQPMYQPFTWSSPKQPRLQSPGLAWYSIPPELRWSSETTQIQVSIPAEILSGYAY